MQRPGERWECLVNELGLANATRAIMAENPGKGDSVAELDDIWQGMSVSQIYEAILARETLHPAASKVIGFWGEIREGANAEIPVPSIAEAPLPMTCNSQL
jgi:hypothetical protein